MSDELSAIKEDYSEHHLPRLKPPRERGVRDKSPKQPTLRGSSLFPPIVHSPVSSSSTRTSIVAFSTTNTESPSSSMVQQSNSRDELKRFMQRHTTSTFSPVPSALTVKNVDRARKTSLYNHVQSRIDTGLARSDGSTQSDVDMHPLGPELSIDWSILRRSLENDAQLRAASKRLQFNVSVTYTHQLTALVNLVRTKVKNFITTTLGNGNERYKIIVNLTVFQTSTSGLHVASRCLWNSTTDNSITFKMLGVDCNVLFVVFLCYTDLGASRPSPSVLYT